MSPTRRERQREDAMGLIQSTETLMPYGPVVTPDPRKEPATPAPCTMPSHDAHTEPAPAAKAASPKILRFLRSERLLHWSIAIPFMVCFVTALILVIFYNPHPQRHFRLIFSCIHKLSGACLAVLPPLVLLLHCKDYKTHLHNIKHGWTWVLDDFKWLMLMGPAAISSRISLPEQGKFNAAEKLNFMMVMSSFPLFVSTGVLLWMPGVHFIPWLAHVGMALLTTPLIVGHIFMATVNPSTRVGLDGMINGYVDRRWAMHHYRRWYRENFEDSPKVQRPKKRCPACSRSSSEFRVRFGVLGLQAATCPSCGAEGPG
jgi:formate dehydrogenase subunit gamma